MVYLYFYYQHLTPNGVFNIYNIEVFSQSCHFDELEMTKNEHKKNPFLSAFSLSESVLSAYSRIILCHKNQIQYYN